MKKTNIKNRSQNARRRLEANDGPYKVHGGADATDISAKTIMQRREDVLNRLDVSGASDTDKRRRGAGVAVGALVASTLALSAGGAINDGLQDTVERVEVNMDSHNLPPGGQPLEYREGVAYEPGTDNTIVLPPVELEP